MARRFDYKTQRSVLVDEPRISYHADGLGEPYWQVEGIKRFFWSEEDAREALAERDARHAVRKERQVAYENAGLFLGILKSPDMRRRRMVVTGYVAQKDGVTIGRWEKFEDIPVDPAEVLANAANLDAVIEDEQTNEEKEESSTAPVPPERGTITDTQIEEIMNLIYEGRHLEGGFYVGPTTREGVEGMSREDADLYLTSLRGEY